MKDQDYELLSQYLDAELPAADAQVLRQRLMAEPELRATYEQMRSIDKDLRNTFNVPGADTVPQHISNLLAGNSSLAKRRAGWGFAVAASLLAASGLLMNPEWRQTVGDPVLNAALDTTPSSGDSWVTLTDGRKVRPVLSFAHIDGSWCREFLIQDGENKRGIACRSEGQWVTSVMAGQELPGSQGEYRPAGASDADIIDAFISTHAADIALSRGQESVLIEASWQQ